MSESDAYPDLDNSDIAVFRALGMARQVDRGEYLYREGDVTYDFFVLVGAQVDVFVRVDGEERILVHHGPGRFLGELNMLTGLRAFISARVTDPGEVITVSRDHLHRLLATNPRLADIILAAFLARRNLLLEGGAPAIRVIGSRYSPESLRVREFLVRTRIPHEWIDSDSDLHVETLLQQFSIDSSELPVVIATGSVLRNPTPAELGSFLGLTVERLPERCFDLIVVGCGPAGLAASVYGASEGLRTLGLEMVAPGGQAGTSSRIENFLGFPLGISGSDLAQRSMIQAQKFGARLTAPCIATSLTDRAGYLVVTLDDGSEVAGRAVVAASGAAYRRLDADRLHEFEGKGVYYAATEMEAQQCEGNPVVVVGGGNSAGQAALFLAQKSCPVSIAIRGDDLGKSMSHYLVDRIDADSSITVWTSTTITALEGASSLSALRYTKGDEQRWVECYGLFSFIGADPTSEWLSGCAALDEQRFILTDASLRPEDLGDEWDEFGRIPLPFETSHPGLFAVGDVRSGSMKRVASSVGEGSAAVRSVHQYLEFANPLVRSPR